MCPPAMTAADTRSPTMQTTTKPTRERSTVARLARRRPAALLRSLAGLAGGAEETRRGTVLVLILGALALISIVTLVYASIGQADQRAAGTVVRKDTANRSIDSIADFIAREVGDDALAVFIDGYLANGDPLMRREATDYPYTDAFRISIA